MVHQLSPSGTHTVHAPIHNTPASLVDVQVTLMQTCGGHNSHAHI